MDNRSVNGNEGNQNQTAVNLPPGQGPQMDTNQLLAQLVQQMQVMSQLIANQNQNPGPVRDEPERRVPNEEINPPRNEVPRNEIPKGTYPVNMSIEVSYVPHFKALLSMEAETGQIRDHNKTEASKSSSQYTSKKANTSAVHQIKFNSQNPTSYSQYQHDSTPYSARPSTVAKHWTSIISRPAGNQNYHTKTRKPPRKFSKLPNSLSKTFEELKEIGLIKPKHPTPVPNPVSRYWNVNEQCSYHQKPGHHTDNCITLRHAIQDLIDQKII